jgi:hypothetical protein
MLLKIRIPYLSSGWEDSLLDFGLVLVLKTKLKTITRITAVSQIAFAVPELTAYKFCSHVIRKRVPSWW